MKESLPHLCGPRPHMDRLRCKRSLAAAILSMALAGVGIHLFAAWPTGQTFSAAKVQQIRGLHEERLAALRKRVELVEQRCRSGSGSRAELLAAKRDVAEAELDTCASQEERVRVLEKMIADATILESQAAELARKNVASEEVALVIKADLLQLKIRLEEAQSELSSDPQGCNEKLRLSQQFK